MDESHNVLVGWVRDIRKWLETQPGVTEGDGSPLDGVLRVMEYKDLQIAKLQQKLDNEKCPP